MSPVTGSLRHNDEITLSLTDSTTVAHTKCFDLEILNVWAVRGVQFVEIGAEIVHDVHDEPSWTAKGEKKDKANCFSPSTL